MRKIALTFSILCALGRFVYAGPEPYSAGSGKEIKQVAPAPPPCPSWTGFYVGIFGGYKFADTDINLDLTDFWDQFPVARREVQARVQDLNTSGGEFGGLIGYNYEWNNWVFGLEAAGGYLWLRDSETTEKFLDSENGDQFQTAASLKTHYLVTIAPRIGYAFCRWLPYVTGGLALGDIDFNQHVNAYDFTSHQGGRTDDTQAGWMVGTGLEYAITNHWRVRVQYQYIDLGSAGFNHATDLPVATGHSDASLREHNASAALIYGF